MYRTILQSWSRHRVDCRLHELDNGESLRIEPGDGRESILIIEQGQGILNDGRNHTAIEKLNALRAGPDAFGTVRSTSALRILEVSMSTSATPTPRRASIEVRRPDEPDWKQYEYEALGQEVFTPDYEGGLGLLRFIFPQDEIPVHLHPFSGRIIRPISGRGYTYMHPDRYPMGPDTIAAFDANVIHTNGPLKGQNYELWAVQLPWIVSGIDTENVAGFESFVRYVTDVPSPTVRKDRDMLVKLARRQGAGI